MNPVTIGDATLNGDCRDVLKTLPDESVHCCVTSPPYWGLRDYGHPGQIGLEPTPEAYVAELVAVFREVRRVLRSDGVCWLNLGDSYSGGKQGRDDADRGQRHTDGRNPESQSLWKTPKGIQRPVPNGLKPKDLVGIPWRVAFALQADGWYLRQDIIWAKPNPMPESVTDRCCKSHEYMFLLSKSARYYFDAEAIKEDAINGNENVQQVQRTEAHDLFQQEQPAIGRADRNMQGVPVGDSESVESEIQPKRESQGDSGTVLPFGERTEGEAGISAILRTDARAAGTVQDSGASARNGTEVQGSAAEVRYQREGVGNKSGAGSPVCADGQGAILKTQDGDQAQAPDQGDGLHTDADGVDGDQAAVRESVRVLQPDDGAAGNGSCDAAIERRGAYGDEHCASLPDVQRSQGSKNIVGNMPERGVTRTTEGLNLKTAAEKCKGGKRTKRSVWTVATQPYSGAHFATFPPALIEPMILAGCPAQACPTCGKGWERVVEVTKSWRETAYDDSGKQTYRSGSGNQTVRPSCGGMSKSESRTLGHRPACACPPADPIPGVVLDPFGGSGTTGQVASRLGRTAILIELNPEYRTLSDRRTAQGGLMLQARA